MQIVQLVWSEDTAIKVVGFVVITTLELLLQVIKGKVRQVAELPPGGAARTAVRPPRRSRQSARRVSELKRVVARRGPSARPVDGRRAAERRRRQTGRRPGNRAS
ncbi:hypothetical protein [Kitasatospora purpeofusca]|uniref:hypothetical protein n=1 Tax=Kitasatospora purpeofusca TaxID=67352 RepID=UPI002A599DE4|nr:hypothetical protein [Kitasatospora purpeofusca]MDY0816551.1 hypothetical protein [Kitasatospora purpeofusca]